MERVGVPAVSLVLEGGPGVEPVLLGSRGLSFGQRRIRAQRPQLAEHVFGLLAQVVQVGGVGQRLHKLLALRPGSHGWFEGPETLLRT